jgi:hypothetical protein
VNTAFWSEKTRWIVAAAGAIAVLVALLTLFRLPPPSVALVPPSQPQTGAPRPIVQMAEANEADVLAEEMALRDMRPLFLPTERVNVTLPLPRREPGRTFLDDATLKLGVSEAEINISHDLPPVATLGDQPAEKAGAVDALTADQGGLGLLGFGRAEEKIQSLKGRGGFVEVRSTATGHVVLSEVLPLEARPAGDKAWEPLEMLAAVDATGLATPLVITSSSRVEEVDAHFRRFLSHQFRIGERLPPGYYRIVIGP